MGREKKYKKTILIESDDDKALKDAAEHLMKLLGYKEDSMGVYSKPEVLP